MNNDFRFRVEGAEEEVNSHRIHSTINKEKDKFTVLHEGKKSLRFLNDHKSLTPRDGPGPGPTPF